MIIEKEYIDWIGAIKEKVRAAQIKAATVVNRELILFYWDLGALLSNQLAKSNWGDKILDTVSKDLKTEFPDMQGFSKTNLKYIIRFYRYFNHLELRENQIGQQLGDLFGQSGHQPVVFGHQPGDRTEKAKNNEAYSFVSNVLSLLPWRCRVRTPFHMSL